MDVLEDLEDLVDFRVTREQRFPCTHLREDGSDGPHVDAGGVLSATQENLWGTIPKGDNL